MPVQPESKLGSLVEALKEWLPAARLRLEDWIRACREEPALIWQTPAVRCTTYALGGLALVIIVTAIMNLFAPAEAVPKASTADFHVICTNSACGEHFLINREFRFDDFPVVCPRCKEQSGERAACCHSAECKRRWVIPSRRDDVATCPICGSPVRSGD